MKHTAKRSSDRKDVKVNIRLDWGLARDLENLTHGKDVTQSQIIRQALREYFQRKSQEVSA
jgi:predicted transcriptional regulator